MIKSIFETDEEPNPRSKEPENLESEDAIRRELEELNLVSETAPELPPTETHREPETRQVFSKIIELPPNQTEVVEEFSPDFPAPAEIKPENKTFESGFQEFEANPDSPLNEIFSEFRANEAAENQIPPLEAPPKPAVEPPSFFQTEQKQDSMTTAEAIRNSGLAWGAAIGLFGSVIFMMIIGWVLGVLLGVPTLGLVGGIIIGAGIGFYQFFRVTSQIFKK